MSTLNKGTGMDMNTNPDTDPVMVMVKVMERGMDRDMDTDMYTDIEMNIDTDMDTAMDTQILLKYDTLRNGHGHRHGQLLWTWISGHVTV
jgi:hypothetical protein